MKSPPAIFLHRDYYNIFKNLSDESAGKLIKALFEYDRTGKKAEMPNNDGLPGSYALMIEHIQRNKEHYNDICEKRSQAGAKGGAPKKNQNARKDHTFSSDKASFNADDYNEKTKFNK